MYTNHVAVTSPRQPASSSSDSQSSSCGPRGTNQTLYLQKIRESSEAVNGGDFRRAVQLYTEAIQLDPSNHILFTNRSAAYCKLRQFHKSLEDAKRAKQLNSKWAKVGTSNSLQGNLIHISRRCINQVYINVNAISV